MSQKALPRYTYELWQDGIMVASVCGGTEEQARREIEHYAMQYVVDGPVEIRPRNLKGQEP